MASENTFLYQSTFSGVKNIEKVTVPKKRKGYPSIPTGFANIKKIPAWEHLNLRQPAWEARILNTNFWT